MRKHTQRLIGFVMMGGILLMSCSSSDPDAAEVGAGGSAAMGGNSGGSGGIAGGGGSAGGGGLAGGAGSAGAAGGGQLSCPAFVAKSGKGSATYTPIGGSPQTVTDLPEVACRTLRDRNGGVVGYLASFANFAPNTTYRLEELRNRLDRIEVTYFGSYTGDGALADSATYRIQRQDGSSMDGGGTLTISSAGKVGSLAFQDTTISFTCAADDDVAPTAGAALTDAPGRAVLSDAHGAALQLDNIRCHQNTSQFDIGYPFSTVDNAPSGSCLPTQLMLTTPPGGNITGPGTYDLDPGSWIIWDLAYFGRVNTGGSATVTLTSTAPATGTLAVSGGTSWAFSGSFTCPPTQ